MMLHQRQLTQPEVKMKKITGCLVSLLVLAQSGLFTLYAQSSDDAYRTEMFVVNTTPSVEIRTSGGFIEVQGSTGEEVLVEMFVSLRGRYLQPSDTDLSNVEIIIEQDGERIRAEARSTGSSSRWFGLGSSESVSFRVTVPEGAIVDGRTSGGSVSAKGLTNAVYLTTSGGSVTASDLTGTAELRTSGGTLQLDRIDGTLKASTSGGSIRANDIKGAADLSTSGGTIRLENIDAKMNARTSGGSIRANLASAVHDLELRTSGGNIVITLPETEHFDLDLRGQRVHTTLRNFSGEVTRNRVSGKMGNGGPFISARTSGGSVTISH